MGVLFGSDSPIFGIEKQRTEEETTTRPDPLTQESNELRMQQLQDALGVTGGYKKLFGPQSDKLFQLSPQARQALQRYRQQAQQPGLTPNQWYQQALQAIDPSVQIGAAQDVLQRIVTPQLQNRYSQMGLGRSGAMGEAITLGGTQLALPIAQMAQQQRYGIEQQRPNVDTTLRAANLTRAQQAFGAADFQRQLDLANWQRKVGGMTSALGLVPYVAGQDSKGTSRTFGNIMWDLMQMTASLAAAVAGGSYQPTGVTPASIGGNTPMGPAGPGGVGGMPTGPGGAPSPAGYGAPTVPMGGGMQTFNIGAMGGGFGLGF